MSEVKEAVSLILVIAALLALLITPIEAADTFSSDFKKNPIVTTTKAAVVYTDGKKFSSVGKQESFVQVGKKKTISVKVLKKGTKKSYTTKKLSCIRILLPQDGKIYAAYIEASSVKGYL